MKQESLGKATDDVYDELSNDDIDVVMLRLRGQFPEVAGLEPPGLGYCVRFLSLPRFSSERKDDQQKFVQVVNVGDHWIALTNRFSDDVNDVYVYDSLQSAASDGDRAVLQTTSLVRGYPDNMTGTLRLHVRNLQQQTSHTRLCGYYAVAAAISCCFGIDPTGCAYDEVRLRQEVRDIVQPNATGALHPIACFPPPVHQSDMRCTVTDKLYCTCHSKYGDRDMTECSQCKNWFHDDCLTTKPPQRVKKSPSTPWLGPCCAKTSAPTIDLTLGKKPKMSSTASSRAKVFQLYVHLVIYTSFCWKKKKRHYALRASVAKYVKILPVTPK